jgi:antirestriction protein
METATINAGTIIDTPAVWVGCLACYNNGTLRGKWVTARRAGEEMAGDEITYGGQAETRTTNDLGTPYTAPRCSKCGGDEFDVFDHQLIPQSCQTLHAFYANAEKLTELDDAGTLPRLIVLSGWLGRSTSLHDLETFDNDNYVGEWSSFQDYANDLVVETDLLHGVPEELTYYFDYKKWAADLKYDYYYDIETGFTWHVA